MTEATYYLKTTNSVCSYFTCRKTWTIMILGPRKPKWFFHSDINWFIRCSGPSCSLLNFLLHICKVERYWGPWKCSLSSCWHWWQSVPPCGLWAPVWLWVAVSLLEAGPSPGAAACRDCSLPEGLEALPQLGVSRSCHSRARGTEWV